MTEKENNHAVSIYLRRCRWALSALPAHDIDEIIEETRSHILDRIDAGASVTDVLSKMERAEDYASQFIKEHTAASAISSRRADALVSALVTNATGNVLATATLVGLFVVWAFALLFVAVAVMKLFNPATVGLWSGSDVFFLGVIDDPATANELLGVWIFPISFGLFAAAWLVTRRAAMWALHRLIGAV